MSFPTPWTITHRRWEATGTDAQGNDTGTWTDISVLAYGWEITASTEEHDGHRARVTTHARVYAPEAAIGDRDVVLLPGDDREWLVDGEPQDWGHGPFSWRPGVVIELVHTKG